MLLPPDVRAAVLPQALVVEPVDSRDLPRLVVAANERYSIGISYFEAEKEKEGLEGVEAAINEVACTRSASQSSQRDCASAYP
jgi:hypothetical protein